MTLLRSLLTKLGLTSIKAERHPIRVFLLDDDERRHKWFRTRFKGDFLDIADNVLAAQERLAATAYDAIFLDHDLHPEHYHSDSTDDQRTGYAVALWLSANPEIQKASTIMKSSSGWTILLTTTSLPVGILSLIRILTV